MQPHQIEVNLTKGISLSLIGYLSISMMGICAKFLPNLPISTLIFAQFSIGFLLTLPKVIQHGKNSLKTTRPGLMIIRGFSGMLSLAAMYFAIRYIPLVDAVLLQNTIPLFVPIILLVALRKKISPAIWIGLAIGFVGVVLIIKPNAAIISPAALIGLSAGLSSAISVVSTSILKRTESANTITFYFLLIGSIVTAPFMIWHWTPIQAHDIMFLIGLGVFLFIGQLLVTQAFLHGHAHVLAPLSYATVIFTGLLGWLIWNHVPDWLSITGIVLVCLGGIFIILVER